MPKNTKTLIIVESPNKVSSIKKYAGDDYEVVASVGHIRDLPAQPKNNSIGIDLKNNFEPTFILLPDKKEVLSKILTLAEQSKEIIISTDPDIEGHAIAWHLFHYLEKLNKPIHRVIFKTITKDGIKEGLANPGPLDKQAFLLWQNRRSIDRIVGYLVSPFIMSHFGKSLSAGRVQSVACRLITEREIEIEKFVPEEYYTLTTKFLKSNQENFVAKYDGKIQTREQAKQIRQAIIDEPNFIIEKVEAKPKKEKPNPPLITITLQQYCAKKYGFSADRTAALSQSIYERGLCTYIRTDSVRIADEALKEACSYLKEQGYALPKSSIQYSSKNSQADAHEAIRPSDISNDGSDLSGDQFKVYQAIRQHFIASQLTPAIFNTLQVKISGTKNKKLVFKVSGKALSDPGWMVAFGKVDISQINIPLLVEGEVVQSDNKTIVAEQKFTNAPPRYNDGTILQALDSRKIGRPSTFATIIATITHRNYVEKQGSIFKPTQLGREINSLLEKYFSFMDFDYTKRMEDNLDLVAEGKLKPLKMLQDFYAEFKPELEKAYTDNGFDLCKCGGVMLKRKTPKGEFLGCNKFCGNVIVLSRNEQPLKEVV